MHIILTHENSDFDAVAAMLGAWKLYAGALPIMPRRPNRNVRDFLTLYWDALPFVRTEDLPRHPVERAIVVDTQAYSPVKGMTPATEVHFIDHHPLTRKLEPHSTAHIDQVGATTTILVERIAEARLTVSPSEATLLLLGIYEDTGSLSYMTTTSRDIRASAWLLDQGANLAVVNDFLHHPISEEQRRLYNQLIQDAEPYQFAGHAVMVACALAGEVVEEISTLAHKLQDLYDPDALFLLVQMDSHIQLVARSATDAIDVAVIAGAFGGGGHGKAAAALIHGQALRDVHDRLVTLLERHVRPSTTVSQIMSQGVNTLDASATVAEAAALMRRLGHEGFPVVEKGRVVGILTRREIDRAIQLKLGDAAVSLYMTPGEIQVRPDDSVEQLQNIMMEYGVGQVPVVRGGQPIGIVTRTDLIKLWSAPQRRPLAPPDLSARLARVLPPRLDQVLREAGRLADEMDYSLYVVGGFVRDLLLDIPNLDMDLVVEGDAIKLARKLCGKLGGRIRSHSRFGTSKWLPDSTDPATLEIGALDFVTARTEFYEHPTALPTVERSSIKQDLHRRDFTINTLAICLNGARYGALLDFYGGEADLRRGLIRVLHSLSFIEDPTRMLRAARFEQRLGFRIEPRSEDLIGQALDLLGRTSVERIRHELYLILAEAEPERALRRLADLGILGQMSAPLRGDDWLAEHFRLARQERRRLAEAGIFPAGDFRLEGLYMALLVHRLERSEASQFLEGMHIFKEDCTIAYQALDVRAALPALTADRLKRSELYALLEEVSEPALFVAYVACGSWLARQRIELFQRRLKTMRPLTDGKALKKLGLTPGPLYGKIIERLRAAWLDGEVQDEAGERALLATLLRENDQTTFGDQPATLADC